MAFRSMVQIAGFGSQASWSRLAGWQLPNKPGESDKRRAVVGS